MFGRFKITWPRPKKTENMMFEAITNAIKDALKAGVQLIKKFIEILSRSVIVGWLKDLYKQLFKGQVKIGPGDRVGTAEKIRKAIEQGNVIWVSLEGEDSHTFAGAYNTKTNEIVGGYDITAKTKKSDASYGGKLAIYNLKNEDF